MNPDAKKRPPQKKEVQKIEVQKPEKKKRLTYKVILNACGQKTKIDISFDDDFQGFGSGGLTLNVPYSEIKKELPDAEYVESVGLIKEFKIEELLKFLTKHQEDFIEKYNLAWVYKLAVQDVLSLDTSPLSSTAFR